MYYQIWWSLDVSENEVHPHFIGISCFFVANDDENNDELQGFHLDSTEI